MDRTFRSYRDLAELVENLRNSTLTDTEAKVLLYDLVLDGRDRWASRDPGSGSRPRVPRIAGDDAFSPYLTALV